MFDKKSVTRDFSEKFESGDLKKVVGQIKRIEKGALGSEKGEEKMDFIVQTGRIVIEFGQNDQIVGNGLVGDKFFEKLFEIVNM